MIGLKGIIIFIGVSFCSSLLLAEENLALVRRSIFKIRVTSQGLDFKRPWQFQASRISTGSGFYIGQNYILTNAHVVADGIFTTVQRDGDIQPIPAKVLFIAHDCDLAILTVDDPGYFLNMLALSLGEIPKLRVPVSTIGYPTGGEQISVTKGIVSRMSYMMYAHSGYFRHLLVQVDSAINPGNSGGPVFDGDKVIGVAFQTFTEAENTGYIIPTPVIRRFLKAIEKGFYEGVPDLGITIQKWGVLNPATRKFHNLTNDAEGVKVSHVGNWSSAYDKIREGDLLTKIEKYTIGSDGKVPYEGERIDFEAIYDLKQIGDDLGFELIRDGKRIAVNFTLTVSQPHPFAGLTYSKHPRYIVLAGLVFTDLSLSYLQNFGNSWLKKIPLTHKYLLYHSLYEDAFNKFQDYIVLSERLPAQSNAYILEQVQGVVRAVNGHEVYSFGDFVKYIEEDSGEYLVIDFMGSLDSIYLSKKSIVNDNKAINQLYEVKPDRWLDISIDGSTKQLEGDAP